MSQERDLSTRVRDGEFKNKVEYPRHTAPRFGKVGRDFHSFRHERLQAYHEGEREAHDRFKLACFREFGIEQNPKRELLWSKSWELGHASGLSEVLNYLSDLVELIR